MSLETPLEDDKISVHVDWLELFAFLSEDKKSHIDQIRNAFEIGQETEANDIGLDDAESEDLYVTIAEGVTKRKKALCQNSYPFSMSDNGEWLYMSAITHFGHFSYLISLLLNHSWSSGKLQAPTKLTQGELNEGREVFEIISCFAALGFARGPAFLLGTNRQGAEALLARIRNVCEISGEGQARAQLHFAAPINANDDQVDIVAVSLEEDGPPARNFYFGQSAAGANWTQKPIRNVIKGFLEIWFSEEPANTAPLMFTPDYVDQNDLAYWTPRLGHVLHRLRLPKYAAQGRELFDGDFELIRFVEDTEWPAQFLRTYGLRVGTDF